MDKLLEDLNPAQREAVLHTEGPLLILAGAGSGKTRVITYRVATLLTRGLAPWHMLAVTFTNKAAEEMKRRVERLAPGKGRDVLLTTFHTFCAKLLRVEGKAISLSPHFIIYDEHDQKELLKGCLAELNLNDKKFKTGVLVSLISRAKDELIDAESYQIHALASPDPFRQMVARVYHLYQKKLSAAGALDFGDLILKAVELLRERASLRQKYQDRFRYLMIDEYQDTNRAQYVLIKALAAQHRNLCVVGDDDQSIYMWRGADIRNILEFEKEYPDAKVIRLEQNYRSTRPILDAAWQVVQHNHFRKEKKLWTEREGGDPVVVHEYQDERTEARGVAETIKAMIDSGDFRCADFAVFYRINAQSRVLEDALRRAEIPYKIVGTVRFYDRAEVKDVLAYLRVIVNPADSLSLKRILNVPPRGIGKTSVEALERYAGGKNLPLFQALPLVFDAPKLPGRAQTALAELHALLSTLAAERDTLRASEMIDRVLKATKILQLLEEEDDGESLMRAANLRELVNAVAEYEERSEDKSTAGFLELVSLLTDVDTLPEGPNFVTLMTTHLAKGLEFRCVFLTGLEEGLFPMAEADFSQEELEEERRLAYVGMTRAKEHLFLTWAANRRLFGHARWNAPSRFIEEAQVEKTLSPSPSSLVAAATSPSRGEEYSQVSSRPPTGEGMGEGAVALQTAFQVGQRVRHPEFGEGKVIEKSGTGDHLKVVVLFDNGQWKRLLVKYANLQRIS